jgi:hypothetical protein
VRRDETPLAGIADLRVRRCARCPVDPELIWTVGTASRSAYTTVAPVFAASSGEADRSALLRQPTSKPIASTTSKVCRSPCVPHAPLCQYTVRRLSSKKC